MNRRNAEVRLHLNGVDVYTFDSNYRITKFEHNQAVVSAVIYNGTDKMLSFDDEGVMRLPEVDTDTGEEGLNQYSRLDGYLRTYDTNGNFTGAADPAELEYEFDASNRLVNVKSSSGILEWTYLYDAYNRRVARIDQRGLPQDDTIYFQYACDWQVCEELGPDHATVLRQYLYGPGIDNLVSIRDFTGVGGEQAYYYQCNSQGFVGSLVDSTGNVVEYYDYKLFGEPTIMDANLNVLQASTVGNPYMFQSRRYDAETGLYHFRNRQYDPEVGEFLSTDPSGIWQHGQGGGYSAFGGDPINNIDPLGLDWLPSTPEKRAIVRAIGLIDAIKARPAKGVAEKASWKVKDPTDDKKHGSAWGGKRDAVRHCVWVCEMSRCIGEDQAMEVAEIHEDFETPITDELLPDGYKTKKEFEKADREMDEHNNKEGAKVAKGKSGCEDGCNAALKAGKLKVNSPGGYVKQKAKPKTFRQKISTRQRLQGSKRKYK